MIFFHDELPKFEYYMDNDIKSIFYIFFIVTAIIIKLMLDRKWQSTSQATKESKNNIIWSGNLSRHRTNGIIAHTDLRSLRNQSFRKFSTLREKGVRKLRSLEALPMSPKSEISNVGENWDFMWIKVYKRRITISGKNNASLIINKPHWK